MIEMINSIKNKYEPRLYRERMNSSRFESFEARLFETDLWIAVDKQSFSTEIIDLVNAKIYELRMQLNDLIQLNKEFQTSFIPLAAIAGAPAIAADMIEASRKANVGPMAAVAGAFAQYIGEAVKNKFDVKEILIENGGDDYISIEDSLNVSIYAGESPLSEKFLLAVPPGLTPLGVCASSGKFGHSFSFGYADAVMIACKSAILADAYATAFCNKVKNEDDVESVIDEIRCIKDILSAVIICDNKIGICGSFRIFPA